MADVIVTDNDQESGPAESAHAAAVAEGESQVHSEQAGIAAEKAKAAAEAARAMLESQAEAANIAVEAAETAHAESEKTEATSQALYELMKEMHATNQALAAKILADPEPELEPELEPESEESAPVSDEAPAHKEHWYYRRIGKR